MADELYDVGFEAGLNKAVEIVQRRVTWIVEEHYMDDQFDMADLLQLGDDIISDIETEPLPSQRVTDSEADPVDSD